MVAKRELIPTNLLKFPSKVTIICMFQNVAKKTPNRLKGRRHKL